MELIESKADTLKRLTDDPAALMQTIVDHLGTGGTLIELCETWGVPFVTVSRWIKADRRRVEAYERAKAERAEWVEERLLRELRLIAMANPSDAYKPDGSLKDIDQMSESTQRIIQEITVDELFEGVGRDREQIGVTKKVKFYNKTDAIQLAAKNLGLLVERRELNITRKLEDIVAINAEVMNDD